MQQFIALTNQYGLLLVFVGVLLASLGIPIPAMPILIVAGALAADKTFSVFGIFAVAMFACLIGDIAWFAAGRYYGHRVMKMLCRISLSPDSCVRQTETFYERWGAKALLIAKFIPGLSTIAQPLAGAMRLPLQPFLAFDAVGAAIWIGISVGAGLLFRTQIDRAGQYLVGTGTVTLYLAGTLFLLFLAFKWWERQRFYKAMRMARISVAELQRLVHAGTRPVILDVRSGSARRMDARKIPGALQVDMTEPDKNLEHLPRDTEVVVYCSCPNEASAARVARLLMDRGFLRVRPLTGGLDAWLAGGHAAEGAADTAGEAGQAAEKTVL